MNSVLLEKLLALIIAKKLGQPGERNYERGKKINEWVRLPTRGSLRRADKFGKRGTTKLPS